MTSVVQNEVQTNLCQCYHLIIFILRKSCNVLKSNNTGYSKLLLKYQTNKQTKTR